MKDKKLLFDRSCHVLYSRPCKKEIRAKIALHYSEAERETVWEKVQRQYAEFLSDWRTNLGGKRNFHNGVGGTYDCIAIMSYYTVCKAVTSFREIEEMEENLTLPSTGATSAVIPWRLPLPNSSVMKLLSWKRRKKRC